MNEFKGTPGPWGTTPIRTVFPRKTSELRIGSVLDDGTVSAHVVLDGYHYGQEPGSPLSAYGVEVMTADANLIAAAPDLLAALQEWMSAHREVAECAHDEQRAADEREQIAREMAAVAIAKATGETP